MSAENVLRKLDYPAYFELLDSAVAGRPHGDP